MKNVHGSTLQSILLLEGGINDISQPVAHFPLFAALPSALYSISSF